MPSPPLPPLPGLNGFQLSSANILATVTLFVRPPPRSTFFLSGPHLLSTGARGPGTAAPLHLGKRKPLQIPRALPSPTALAYEHLWPGLDATAQAPTVNTLEVTTNSQVQELTIEAIPGPSGWLDRSVALGPLGMLVPPLPHWQTGHRTGHTVQQPQLKLADTQFGAGGKSKAPNCGSLLVSTAACCLRLLGLYSRQCSRVPSPAVRPATRVRVPTALRAESRRRAGPRFCRWWSWRMAWGICVHALGSRPLFKRKLD